MELNGISKSVLRLSERFFSKSALALSNRYPQKVYFKHVLFQRARKILTTIKFFKGRTLVSSINWRRLGFSLSAMRDICCISVVIKALLF